MNFWIYVGALFIAVVIICSVLVNCANDIKATFQSQTKNILNETTRPAPAMSVECSIYSERFSDIEMAISALSDKLDDIKSVLDDVQFEATAGHERALRIHAGMALIKADLASIESFQQDSFNDHLYWATQETMARVNALYYHLMDGEDYTRAEKHIDDICNPESYQQVKEQLESGSAEMSKWAFNYWRENEYFQKKEEAK